MIMINRAMINENLINSDNMNKKSIMNILNKIIKFLISHKI